MEKPVADEFIGRYLKKIYGFSVSKTFSLAEAEELCADITCEVYASLLKMPELYNPDGYVWRISENVYSRHVMRTRRDAHTPLDGLDIPFETDLDEEDDLLREYALLRREIAYLTKTRREIIMLHYFEKLKIAEITSKMRLPAGTVKWHLSRARDELKEGFKMNRPIGKLGLAPVKLEMGHSGTPGRLGGPEAFVSGTIEQNVIYSVYFAPKDEREIADELGISPVYLDDIIDKLERNGFLTRTKNNKLTTFVFIAAYSREAEEAESEARLEVAHLLQKEYAPLVLKAAQSISNVYIPGENRLLLYATLLSFAVMNNNEFGQRQDLTKYRIKPTDGGDYIAHAYPKVTDNVALIQKGKEWLYNICGPMTRCSEKYPGVGSWSLDSVLSAREGAWQNNLTEDYDYLYEFIFGKLPVGPENAEKYKRLLDRRFLGDNGTVQTIVSKNSLEALQNAMPALPESLKVKLAAFAGQSYEIKKQLHPPQMHAFVYAQCQRVVTPQTAITLQHMMIEDGSLPVFTDTERVALNLLMFSDRLPEA
jgi:RNA polymerase sigma factor (sigma-70 family)